MWIGSWIALSIVYLLFAGKLEPAHVVAAFILGAGSAVLASRICREASLHFRVKWRWALVMAGVIPRFFGDLPLLGKTLWQALIQSRRPQGALKEIPFDAGGDDALSRARRALVLSGVSFPPNAYAVGVRREKGSLLVHQLAPSPAGSGNPKWPL